VDLDLQGTLERWFFKKQNSLSLESDEQKTLKPAQLGEHKQGCYTSEEPTNMDHNHMKRRKTRSLSSESLDYRIQAETIKLEKQPAEINKGEEGRPKGTQPIKTNQAARKSQNIKEGKKLRWKASGPWIVITRENGAEEKMNMRRLNRWISHSLRKSREIYPKRGEEKPLMSPKELRALADKLEQEEKTKAELRKRQQAALPKHEYSEEEIARYLRGEKVSMGPRYKMYRCSLPQGRPSLMIAALQAVTGIGALRVGLALWSKNTASWLLLIQELPAEKTQALSPLRLATELDLHTARREVIKGATRRLKESEGKGAWRTSLEMLVKSARSGDGTKFTAPAQETDSARQGSEALPSQQGADGSMSGGFLR